MRTAGRAPHRVSTGPRAANSEALGARSVPGISNRSQPPPRAAATPPDHSRPKNLQSGYIDLVSHRRTGRRNACPLPILGKRCHGIDGKIQRFRSRPIEPPSIHGCARATQRQGSPFRHVVAVENAVRPDPYGGHPVAPTLNSSRYVSTASVWPSATNSAAVRCR